jgi:hypothetical protein
LRATIVAGLGGLVIGHVLWLVGIKLASNSQSVSFWVLVVAGISFALALAGGLVGWVCYRRKAFAKAAFLWGLPISPLLFSLAVLGVTYL